MSQAGQAGRTIIPPGQFVETLTGNSGGAVSPDGSGNINVVGDGTTATVAGNPGLNTLTISSIIPSGTFIETLTGDTGGAVSPTVGGNIDILAGLSTLLCGSTVSMVGDVLNSSITLNVTDANSNTIIGSGSGNATISGNLNTVFGASSGEALTSGAQNTFLGWNTGSNTTAGSNNLYVGNNINPLNESSTVRIGNTSTTRCFIPAVRTDTTDTNPRPMNVDANGQLCWTRGSVALWALDTGSPVTLQGNKGFVVNTGATQTYLLQSPLSFGDVIRISGNPTVGGQWTITQSAGVTIYFGNVATTTGVGGSLSSTNSGDCVELLCLGTNNAVVLSSIGNITVV